MKSKYRADLHFHPSFMDPQGLPMKTEKTAPSLRAVVEKAYEKGLNIVTITSCDNAVAVDPRWDAYRGDTLIVPGFKVAYKGKNEIGYVDPDGGELHIVHGRELKTDKGDMNVLFSQRKIPLKASSSDPELLDFDYTLQGTLDSGDKPLILMSAGQNLGLKRKEIIDLYDDCKIDGLEAWDGMDSERNNEDNIVYAKGMGVPAAVVSDGHDLASLGVAGMSFNLDVEGRGKARFLDMSDKLVDKLREGDFNAWFGVCSPTSKALYKVRFFEHVTRQRIDEGREGVKRLKEAGKEFKKKLDGLFSRS